jgi:outer membrane scaffolding protein for murein synthesis (MipA/OmpV family)
MSGRRLLGAMRLILRFGLAALAPGASAYAQAALTEEQLEQVGAPPTAPKEPWNVTLGIGVAGVPTYDGAERYYARPVPLVHINYRGPFFLGRTGLGANVVPLQGLRIGPSFAYGGGRKESDDPHLAGLGDVQPAILAGLFATYDLGPVRFGAVIRQAVTHERDGLQGRVGVAYRWRLDDERLLFSAGPALALGNARYMRTYFGVTAAQSAASGLPEFTPHGGVKDVALEFSLTYRVTDHILLQSFGAVREFVGDSANSPIVESKTQGQVGLGVAYHF